MVGREINVGGVEYVIERPDPKMMMILVWNAVVRYWVERKGECFISPSRVRTDPVLKHIAGGANAENNLRRLLEFAKDHGAAEKCGQRWLIKAKFDLGA